MLVTTRRLIVGTLGLCLMIAARGAAAEEKADLSTPKKAAAVFANAIEGGDLPAVRQASVGGEDDYKLLSSIIDFMAANNALRKAAHDQFGPEGDKITEDPHSLSKGVAGSEEKIDADGKSATLAKDPNDKDPIKLKKIEGDWKVDLASMPGKEKVGALMPKMRDVYTRAAADIKAGKFKTADEAKQVIDQQMFAVIVPLLNDQTTPTTKPMRDKIELAPQKK